MAAAQVVGAASCRCARRSAWCSSYRPTRSPKARNGARPAHDTDTARLENELAERLGAQVGVEPAYGAGRIVIRYGTLEELDGIVAAVGLKS